MNVQPPPHGSATWRARLYRIIFEADTPAGRRFDVFLIAAIVTSVAVVLLESVASIRARHGSALFALEWFFTVLFTVEYILRLLTVRRPRSYATSFLGVIDFVAVIPTWAALIIPGSQYFVTIRILRLLRIFRVLKLTEYMVEAGVISSALRASRRKIFVFLFAVVTLVVIVAALIYVIEGPEHGYSDIPTAMYWAIVTLTTVGYGDISPGTPVGKLLASLLMITGYSIIAVPTGIVTAEMTVRRGSAEPRDCPACGRSGHDGDARHCKFCGGALESLTPTAAS
jgi:voltage-gated potassium channel